MMHSIKLKSKDLRCPKHQNDIHYLCLNDKFQMKNRVLCEDCIKDKSTYSDWTPLDNIQDLISNILETDKLMKSNALRQSKKLKEEIIKEIEQIELKIIDMQQTVDHTKLIKKVLGLNQLTVYDLQELSENLSYLTLYTQYKNVVKSPTLIDDQLQPILLSMNTIKQNLKQTYQQLINIETEENTVADHKLLFKSTPVIIPAHDYAINSVAITPDCTKIITASSEGRLKVWDTRSHCELQNFSDDFDYAFNVIISSDGQYIAASGSGDHIIRVWNIDNLQVPEQRLKYHTKTVERIVFIPQSQQIISVSQDHQVVVWHVTKPEPSRVLKHHKSSVKGIAISSNCKLMATTALDKQLIVWNVQNNFSILQQLKPHNTPCNCVEFSSDVKFMVTGGEDGIVKLWKVQNWEPLLEFIGHSTFVWTVGFSNQANLIISASTKEIKIWNIVSQQQQQSFAIQQDYYPNFCLSSNQQLLCTGQQNGDLYIWKSAVN